AVTMAQASADRLGLRVNDRFCLEPTSGRQPGWCARLVGLWQPTDLRDPYWGGGTPRTQLTMGRHDFFRLMNLYPAQPAVAGLRYQADPARIDTGEAAGVAQQVRQHSSVLRRAGLRRVA